MGRPKDIPLKREGRFIYVRLGERLICFAAELIQKDELECIKAINNGYDKGIDTELSDAQHNRLQRILNHYLAG
jgi:hypothetical protein